MVAYETLEIGELLKVLFIFGRIISFPSVVFPKPITMCGVDLYFILTEGVYTLKSSPIFTLEVLTILAFASVNSFPINL